MHNRWKRKLTVKFCTFWFITVRKRSLGQGNVFTPVCHSVHRGRGSLQPPVGRPGIWEEPTLGRPPRRRPLSRPPWMPTHPDAEPPPPGYINKRAVRILLECILVRYKYS